MTKLDLTKPMQTRGGGKVRFVGYLENFGKQKLAFEFQDVNGQWTLDSYFEEGKWMQNNDGLYDIINTPEPPLEIKVDHFYWAAPIREDQRSLTVKVVVKIFFKDMSDKYYGLYIGIHERSHSVYMDQNLLFDRNGKQINVKDVGYNLTRELTPEEIAEHVYGEKPKQEQDCIADQITCKCPFCLSIHANKEKTTNLTREEMLKAVDAGKK